MRKREVCVIFRYNEQSTHESFDYSQECKCGFKEEKICVYIPKSLNHMLQAKHNSIGKRERKQHLKKVIVSHYFRLSRFLSIQYGFLSFSTKDNIQENGGLNHINLSFLVYSFWLKHKQCVSLEDLTRTASHVSNGTEITSKTGDKSFVGGCS